MMRTNPFSAEEMYVIERDADLKSAVASENIFKLAHLLMVQNVDYSNDKEKRLELGKIVMALIQEQHRSSDIYKSIRDKCEKIRMGATENEQD